MAWGDASVLKVRARVLWFCAWVPWDDFPFPPDFILGCKGNYLRAPGEELGSWRDGWALQRFLGTPGRCLLALRKCLCHPRRFSSCPVAMLGNLGEVLGCPGVMRGCSTEVLSFTREVLQWPVEMLECSGRCLRSLGNAWLPGEDACGIQGGA